MTFRGKDLYAVSLLSLIAMFLFADQNLMAPNLTMIGDEFGFTPEQRDVKLGGHIALVFWMCGGIITLAIGPLTDRASRKWLLGGVVLVGEIPCLLTGFAETYDQLFWLRAATGIGVGGAIPLVYSLIGDYFPPHQRAKAAAFVGLAMGLGIAVGQGVAGHIGESLGDWRLPFILVALPSFPLGLLFLFTIEEPERGRAEASLGDLVESGHSVGGKLSLETYRNLFRIRSNLLVFLQGAFGTVPWGVFFVYLNDYYAQDKGYGVAAATNLVLAIGAATLVGGFLGGLIGNRLYNRHPRYMPMFCGISTLLGVIPTALLINWPDQSGVEDPSILGPLLIGLLCGVTVSMTSPNVRTMLLNINAPTTRGSIFSLYNLADDLGRGLGPFAISAMILVMGRQWAFNAANLLWVICGVLLLVLIRAFPRDEAALEAEMAREAERIAGAARPDDR